MRQDLNVGDDCTSAGCTLYELDVVKVPKWEVYLSKEEEPISSRPGCSESLHM